MGIFLSLVTVLFNQGHLSANRFLAGVLFFASFFTLVNFAVVFSRSIYWVAIFQTSCNTFFFLIGPLSYFYVRSVLRDNSKLSKWDYLHFLLFLFIFSGTLRFLFTSWAHKLEVAQMLISGAPILPKYRIQDFLPPYLNNGIRPFHFFFYIILNWKLIFQFKGPVKAPYGQITHFKLLRNWLYCFNGLLTIMAFIFSVLILKIFFFRAADGLESAYPFFLFIALGYSALNIVLLIFPKILYGLPFEQAPNSVLQITPSNGEPMIAPIIEEDQELEDKINDQRKLPQFYSAQYITQIQQLLTIAEDKKLFLQPEFSIDDLAAGSDIPTHHISYYFNNIIKVKFTEWRNNNRIAHAIALINDGNLEALNFKWIAAQSGFSTQSTFIRAFKTVTNCSPSEYLLVVKQGAVT